MRVITNLSDLTTGARIFDDLSVITEVSIENTFRGLIMDINELEEKFEKKGNMKMAEVLSGYSAEILEIAEQVKMISNSLK